MYEDEIAHLTELAIEVGYRMVNGRAWCNWKRVVADSGTNRHFAHVAAKIGPLLEALHPPAPLTEEAPFLAHVISFEELKPEQVTTLVTKARTGLRRSKRKRLQRQTKTPAKGELTAFQLSEFILRIVRP